MSAEDLLTLKLYMHVYHDDDDLLIFKTWGAAVEYLAGGGVAMDGSQRCWLAAAGLTLHWYENPGFTGTDTGLPVGVRTIINQLKLDQGGADYF